MTLGVVAAIGVGMYLVGRESRRRESARPNESLVQTAATIAAVGVPTVLALRGVGGLVASAFELGTATPIFRRWDLLLYSPLCIVLAVAAAVAIAPPGPPAPVSGRTDTQPKMAPT